MTMRATILCIGLLLGSAAAAAGQTNTAPTNLPPKTATNAFNLARPPTLTPDKTTDALLTHGFDELGRGNGSSAISYFTRVLTLDSTNKRGRFGMGTALIQLERYREALTILEPMLKEFPTDYTLKNNVAWVYAAAKDPSIRDGHRAIALAQEALLNLPTDCHVWSSLAEGYYITGRYEKALRAADEALRLCQQTGGSEELRREYQRLVERNRKAVQAMSLIE